MMLNNCEAPKKFLISNYYCNLTNIPKLSFKVSFTFLVMARQIEILEAIDNIKMAQIQDSGRVKLFSYQ